METIEGIMANPISALCSYRYALSLYFNRWNLHKAKRNIILCAKLDLNYQGLSLHNK